MAIVGMGRPASDADATSTAPVRLVRVSAIAVDMTTAACSDDPVRFEGIPTLNQYGLAILALLMLGVGFVGFRRFV